MSANSYNVFISYQSADLEFAEQLNARLVDEGFQVWFDKARLEAGCDWHSEIEAGCESSRIFLPVLTPHWKGSEWTRYETYGAEAVIPLHYDGEWDEVATPPLMRYQNLALNFKEDTDDEWKKLFDSIRRLLAQPLPEKVERIANLRYSANPYFVGRETDLNKIHETLHRRPTAALTQDGTVQAITALGGVGKTTMAREYAEKFWRLYPQIFWIDARINLVSEFARLAEILVPKLYTTDDQKKAEEAFNLLNDQTERLLIIDNAIDEESVQTWIPKSGGCRTIITSRFADWSSAIKVCPIDVLKPEPSREFLLLRTEREPTRENNDKCDLLAEKLGHLPLALDQAAAYIHAQGLDFGFDDYLRLYDKAHHELLNKGVLGSTEYPDSVITTWKATIAKLSPPARAVLRLIAFLSNERIPTEMFIKGAETVTRGAGEFDGKDEDSRTNRSLDEFFIRDAIKNLASYSMITTYGNDFTVHALVQTVERLDIYDKRKQADWIERTTELITSQGPLNAHDTNTWHIWDALMPHAEQLLEHTLINTLVQPNIKLPSRLANLYFGKGMYYKAIPLYQKIIKIIEKNPHQTKMI